MSETHSKIINCLCLSSGGTMGTAMLGYLHALYNNGILTMQASDGIPYLRNYIGCSVGTILSTLLASGYTPLEIVDSALTMSLGSGLENVRFDTLKQYGIIDHDIVVEPIRHLLINKFGRHNITLLELFQMTRKRVIYVVTNLDTMKPNYLDYITNPDLQCIDAIKMSSNIPLVFPKIEHDNISYVDGALTDPFPISYFDSLSDANHTIGVCTMADEKEIPNAGITGYIYRCIYTPMFEIDRLHRKHLSVRCHIIDLPIQGLSLLGKDKSKNARIDAFLLGYITTCTYINNHREHIMTTDTSQQHAIYRHKNFAPQILDNTSEISPSNVNISDCVYAMQDPSDRNCVIIHYNNILSILVPRNGTVDETLSRWKPR